MLAVSIRPMLFHPPAVVHGAISVIAKPHSTTHVFAAAHSGPKSRKPGHRSQKKKIPFRNFLLMEYTGCPTSTAYSENIAVYIQCPNIIKTLKLCFFKWKLPSLILFLNSMLNYESNLYRSFLLTCHRF
jgi:hypothetical protein